MPPVLRTLAVSATCAAGVLATAGPASALTAHPVTLAQLQSAPVPSLCGHPAGRLVKGALPGIPAGAGKVVLAATAAHHGSNVLALGDLNGDGVKDAAVVVQCTTSSTSRPSSVQLYTSGGKRLGGLDLSSYTHRSTDVVAKLTISHGTVFVHWSANQRGDAAGQATLDYSVQLRISRGTVVASHATSYAEGRAAGFFVGDVRLGNLKAAKVLATPAVLAQAIAATRSGTLGEGFQCYGAPTRDKLWRGDVLDAVGAGLGYPAWLLTNERYCVSLNASQTRWSVLRMKHLGWHLWKADLLVQAKVTG